MKTPYHHIGSEFARLRRETKARHRDIAASLNISEGELIAAHVGQTRDSALLRASRLRADWPALIGALEPLGEVLALTRNASCVHEKVGIYRKASHQNQVGLVLNGDIDLRIFYSQWTHGFAVTETSDHGVQRSLQFFDVAGVAIHKIFLKPQSNVQAYEALVRAFADAQQCTGITVFPADAPPPELDDDRINLNEFHQAWRSLRDTHDFFSLLKAHSLSRIQGLRLAESQYVQKTDASSVHQLLEAAARENVPIMVFVGNPGMIQIHSGTIRKVAVMGEWINVLDPRFNLHLRESEIASAWVVKKPTVDGLVTSLELFDKDGEVIAMFFGERKPGKPELCAWRALIDNLFLESQTCRA